MSLVEIQLSPELDLFVREQVANGVGADPEDVIRTALVQMRDRAHKLAQVKHSFLMDELETSQP